MAGLTDLINYNKGLLALLTLYIVNPVTAHTGPSGHHAGHMTGYGMWGTGWTSMFFGLSTSILLVLAIVYGFQKLRGGENE